ncbi:centromere protein Chl4/mis15/CENP-N [Pseudomassariella vexata]|uniref:Centromere protein Chl4/mis15/CENP-N n=1 Tax=Pseudomassariella vexata TaxID=1141098 RepID=A0A1Y2D9Y7_9PEZI|nr:centromere protein Chl4/mis15/CENP-N [Pseudomassariella vexata]ORY56083.1 centromere protein Chl4/mis15/CENP-N [Pseudomassariella vexata]
MARLSVPTTARLPSSLRVDASTSAVTKVLNRLSRASLLSLVVDWLGESNQTLCPPLLRRDKEDDDDVDEFYPLAQSLEELRELYADMQAAKGSKREVVDRIVEGDWRMGLSLYQLAMADMRYLYDHPGSLKWIAYRIQQLKSPLNEAEADGAEKPDKETLAIPRFHPSTFLQNLQAEVLPDVKAHYNFDRPEGMPLWLLRIFILDSPYNTTLAVSNRTGDRATTSFDASRTLYIAFPDASPHIYISKSQSTGPAAPGESRSLHSLIVDGIPKALSRPRERYTLNKTNLSTKNLSGLLHIRGAGRTNAAGGGWGIYSELKPTDSPLNPILPTPPLSEDSSSEPMIDNRPVSRTHKRALGPEESRRERAIKRAKMAAQARFGSSAKVDDRKGMERLDIMIEDPFPNTPGVSAPQNEAEAGEAEELERSQSSKSKGRRSGLELEFEQVRDLAEIAGEGSREGTWKPNVRLTFQGSHVFAGIRQLVEAGVINGGRMPGWMTGEEGVSIGAVRDGRIRGHKGSGL